MCGTYVSSYLSNRGDYDCTSDHDCDDGCNDWVDAAVGEITGAMIDEARIVIIIMAMIV